MTKKITKSKHHDTLVKEMLDKRSVPKYVIYVHANHEWTIGINWVLRIKGRYGSSTGSNVYGHEKSISSHFRFDVIEHSPIIAANTS